MSEAPSNLEDFLAQLLDAVWPTRDRSSTSCRARTWPTWLFLATQRLELHITCDPMECGGKALISPANSRGCTPLLNSVGTVFRAFPRWPSRSSDCTDVLANITSSLLSPFL
jgi:hypothetical protein